jgi:hypothetical protein
MYGLSVLTWMIMQNDARWLLLWLYMHLTNSSDHLNHCLETSFLSSWSFTDNVIILIWLLNITAQLISHQCPILIIMNCCSSRVGCALALPGAVGWEFSGIRRAAYPMVTINANYMWTQGLLWCCELHYLSQMYQFGWQILSWFLVVLLVLHDSKNNRSQRWGFEEWHLFNIVILSNGSWWHRQTGQPRGHHWLWQWCNCRVQF